MDSVPFLFLKDMGFAKLLLDKQGRTWLFWTLTPRQQTFLGLNINPFVCFWKYDLCQLHLKRPHLTCLTCKLRRVIAGKIPFAIPVNICQVWDLPTKSNLQKFIFKEILSLAETLS